MTVAALGFRSTLQKYVHTTILRFWVASWWGSQHLAHYPEKHVPRSLLNMSLASLAHFCMPCRDHPCSNCSEKIPGSSFHHLLFQYANRTSVVLLKKKGGVFMLFVRLLQKHAQFTFLCLQCHSSVHRLLLRTTALYDVSNDKFTTLSTVTCELGC
jgi:hypothetical protein